MTTKRKRVFRNTGHFNNTHRLTVRCTQCGHARSIICVETEDIQRSSRIDILNNGICSGGKNISRHIDCLIGCTHSIALMLLARVMSFPFTRKPVYGYGEIINDEMLQSVHSVDMPGIQEFLDSDVVFE